jgi:hypothetical protein
LLDEQAKRRQPEIMAKRKRKRRARQAAYGLEFAESVREHNPIAGWQLSVEHLRVFYEVAGDDNGPVRILAIGRKHGNALTIGGKEIQL